MSQRRFEILLFMLLWGSFAWFHHSGEKAGWNVNSRFALTLAIVERGTVRIDDYDQAPDTRTDDVAVFNGHVYSDKVFGVSLLGVPATALVRGVERLAGDRLPTDTRRYLVTLFSVGLLGALSGVLLFRLMLLVGGPGSPLGPFLLTAVTFLGSMLFLYATLFMAYLPAQFFSLWAVLRFERWKLRHAEFHPSDVTGATDATPPLLSCGLLFGTAMLCEYTVCLAAALHTIYALLSMPRKRDVWRYAVGIVVALAPFFVYTICIFGRLAIPYQFERNELFREFMARGVMGATTPRLSVLYLITLHPYRGLFIHSPFLLVALAGLYRMMRDRHQRGLACFVLSLSAAFLLFNSAYYMWWGGWSFSPRILAPMVPFLAIPLGAVWQDWRLRATALALGAIGIAIHLIVNAVDPQFRDLNSYTSLPQLLNPGFGTSYRWLFPFYISPLFWQGQTDWNLGRLLGLDGPSSVIPLLVFWACVTGIATWWSRPLGINSTSRG